MSLAIKIDSGNYQGFVYFDAVTQYTQDLSGQVTSHPIGSGGLINDHFIRGNPTYQFSGVISAADISVGLNAITDGGLNRPMNIRGDVSPVNVKGNNNSLISLVPQTISQFFVDAGTSVSMSKDSRASVLKEVKSVLKSLFKKDGITTVKLFEYEGVRLKEIIENLVVKGLGFTEDPDSGQALWVNITLEQVTFTELQQRKLSASELAKLKPVNVKAPLKEAASSVVDKGTNPTKSGERGTALAEIKEGLAPPPAIVKDDALMKRIKEMQELEKELNDDVGG